MDFSRYQDEFPVRKSYIYFNHASVAPLPRRSAKAMQNFAQQVMEHAANRYSEWLRTYQGVRAAAAAMLGCDPGEIALTKNTSEGLAVVANGLDWRPGDIVVGIEDEFPANYFPWLRLQRRGVKTRWLKLHRGRIELEELDRACCGARLLAVSFVQYLSGFRIDLDAVGEVCRRRGALLVVDGVQGLGPYPVNVKRSGVHALSASAHKWLLGPEGCGVLFLDRELLPRVEPVEFGWTNVEGSETYSRDERLRTDASRYECGTLNTIGYIGLEKSLELFLEIGADRMARCVNRAAQHVYTGAREKGYELLAERIPECGSGIVSLRKEGVDSQQAVAELKRQAVVTAHRAGWIRVSPHFYAGEEEVAKFLELLP